MRGGTKTSDDAATTSATSSSTTASSKPAPIPVSTPIKEKEKKLHVAEIPTPQNGPNAIQERNQNARAQQQAQHTAVISLTVKNTNKILKEIGFRRPRLRNVYKKCNDAIKILNDFKDAQWPPKPNNNTSASATRINQDGLISTAETDMETVMSDNDVDADTDVDTIMSESVAKDDSDAALVVVEKEDADGDVNADGMECAPNGGVSFESVDSVDITNVNGDVIDKDAEFGTDDKNTSNTDKAQDQDQDDSAAATDTDDNKKLNPGITNAPSEDDVKSKSKNLLIDALESSNILDDHANGTTNGSSNNNKNANDTSNGTKNTYTDGIGGGSGNDISGLGKGVNNDQMHPAIKTALSCYCAVINHESSSPKMFEIALECIGLLISNRYVVGSTIATVPSSKNRDGNNGNEKEDEEDGNSGSDDNNETRQSEILYLINCICERADHASDTVQTAMSKALLALMTSPVCGVYEAGMLKAVRTVFHIYLVTKHDNVKSVTRAVLLDMLRSVFSRMEAYDAISLDESNTSSGDGGQGPYAPVSASGLPRSKSFNEETTIFASRFHTDSYLLFRALCKLSAKLLPEDVNDASSTTSSRKSIFGTNTPVTDPMATNTKILSLRLILSVFEHCGPAFRDGEKFIYAVQNFLCVSLVKNSMSNNPRVAHLSLKVFLLLVYKFKQHLKSEIEVFVAKVFLPTLQSPNTPEERKSLVLEALRALCADPVILTQIFLNYDCDFEAVDLYKTIVHHLTSLSIKNHRIESTTVDGSEKFSVSLAALEVLVVTLQAFLKALKLPGGDDILDEERSKVRGNLQLDVGLAVKNEAENSALNDSMKEEMVVSAKDIENIENSMSNDIYNTPSDDVAGKIVDVFDKKRIAQRNFETGSIKFRLNGKQGLLFFVQHGFLHLDAKEVALFFLENKETLDKTQMGEIFGREPEASFVKGKDIDPEKGGLGFYIRVLHHYVDALNFEGLKFDDAIRLFLSGFRLPGESQKVDRIMEKFAERYTLQNEEVFPSADTAFILSFAIIMLQTDLHNVNIKPEKKMTAESFIKMNKGISVDGGDLDSDFLREVFESIKARPFTLKEDDDARESMEKVKDKIDYDAFFGGTNAKDKRRERFNKERAELVEASEQLFKKQKPLSMTPKHLTESICPADVVKPMFDITWGPLIGTLSQILEKASDDSSIKLCLNGFVYAVRIAAYSDMDFAKHTFVTSLAKFTALGSADEMKTRNIESIRTLLSISIMDGEKLGDSWRPILQCISQIGRLQFFASGVDSDDVFLKSEETKAKPSKNGKDSTPRRDTIQRKDSNIKSTVARETEEFNSQVVLEAINEILIEKIFTSTTQLSDSAILHFVQSLVHVSESEIGGDSKKDISGVGLAVSGARIFSLQKLVEVADYNMDIRSRRSWAKIWDLMSGHLGTNGCHKNAMVSMFAIDALRQLSFKFLEKPELADFNFQRLFLRPFLSIMEDPGTLEDTRELILQCVDNSIRSLSHNIRSGWKIFFSILARTADDPSEKISSFGLAILQRLLDNHIDQLCKMDEKTADETLDGDKTERTMSASEAKERNTHVEDFTGLCRASIAFVESTKGHSTSISMRALCHAAVYADYIAEGKVLPPVSGTQSNDKSAFGYTYDNLSDDEAKEMVLWRPILDGLAHGMCSSMSYGSTEGAGCIVQRASVITLRAILLRHGHRFSASQWVVIMNEVILPAMQIAIKTDNTHVTKIISESPIVSNLDFFSAPLSLPPPNSNAGLLKFAAAAQSFNAGPTRPYGDSELLVEASFADLRHGGDGDLTKAYLLVEKVVSGEIGNHDEPFPDSWVATTGPIALSMLTDFFCMIVMRYNVDDARKMWPIVMGQMQQWAVGCPLTSENDSTAWSPCEALVRIGCKEISRLSETLITLLPRMEKSEVKLWLNALCKNLGDTLSYSAELEGKLYAEYKRVAYVKMGQEPPEEEPFEEENLVPLVPVTKVEKSPISVSTPYGDGVIIHQRVDKYLTSSIEIDVVRLDSGATLYGPKVVSETQVDAIARDAQNDTILQNKDKAPEMVNVEVEEVVQEGASGPDLSPRASNLQQFISPLRVRCTAAYCLQKCFLDFLDLLSTNCGKEEVSALLNALEKSRRVASKASVDKDLSASFEEAILVEWGDKVEDTKKAFSSDGGVGHLRRSEMFFLTQEASANNILIHFLALLYCPREDESVNQWDTVSFSEPLLIERITDVLQKFIESEREDGHRIDPNVWRAASESGGTFAVHCTSFAVVVVNILNTMMRFSDSQFDGQKGRIFPILCSLITIHSSEIRDLVAGVMKRKVSVLLGINN